MKQLLDIFLTCLNCHRLSFDSIRSAGNGRKSLLAWLSIYKYNAAVKKPGRQQEKKNLAVCPVFLL